jgi:hypothetical protein
VILTQVLSQEIHTIADVGDDCFLRRERQATLLEEGFHHWFDLGLQERPISAGDDKIIGEACEVDPWAIRPLGWPVPHQEPLQSIERAIRKARGKRTSLSGAALRGIASAMFKGIHSFWRGTLLRATRPLAGIRPRR